MKKIVITGDVVELFSAVYNLGSSWHVVECEETGEFSKSGKPLLHVVLVKEC